MEIVIRQMQPKEALTVWKLGIMTFHSMEGIFMGKPKNAMVAVNGETIVGGVTYTTYPYKGGILGYVDYAFVDRHYHGQGIGTKLYEATTKRLQELGCTQTFGLVRGDNLGSFLLFEKQNMQRCNLKEAKQLLGFSGLLRMMLTTPLNWGPAMDCYLSNVKKRRDCASQILWYLLINLSLMLLGTVVYKADIPQVLAAAATVMVAGVVLSSSIHLMHQKEYHFRLSIGGGFVTAIVALLGGIFPMYGKWYPTKFDASKKQKRELGISAMIEWLGILALYVVSSKVAPEVSYCRYVHYFCSAMTIFRMIPSFPFNEYGGRRVYEYNKWLYGGLWIVSAIALYFL